VRDNDRKIAIELKENLSKITPIVDFRVYGSRAREDADADSDMDVFIEVESLDRALKDRIRQITWEVSFEHYTLISEVIFTRDEIEKSPLRASPLVKNILNEGIPI
jgi:uncharacterized protein